MDSVVFDLIKNSDADNTLFKLEDVSNIRVWNYELPTLTSKGRFLDRQRWKDSSSFASTFYELFPMFESIDMEDIAVKGGVVFDILHKRDLRSIHDIDLYIIGDYNCDQIVDRATKFIKDIYDYMVQKNQEFESKRKELASKRLDDDSNYNSWQDKKKVYDLSKFHVNRYGPCVTISAPCVSKPIQLILCPILDIPTLLRDSDISCCALVFYKNEVYFNAISKFSFENSCLILSKPLSSSQFSRRLVRYYEKDVDIIFPHLDITKLSRRNFKYNTSEVLELPYFVVIYSDISKNKIFALRVQEPNNNTSTESSFYEHNVADGGIAIHKNICYLIHDQWKKFTFNGSGEFAIEALLPVPNITVRMISNTYENVSEKLSPPYLNIIELQKYFAIEKVSTILQKIIIEPMINAENSYQIKDADTQLEDSKEYLIPAKKYLTNLIERQIEHAKAKVEELKEKAIQNQEDFPVAFHSFADVFGITKSSFEEWYSGYYLKHEV